MKFDYSIRRGTNCQIGDMLYEQPITEKECWILEYVDVICKKNNVQILSRSSVIQTFREIENFNGQYWKRAINYCIEKYGDQPDWTIMRRVKTLYISIVRKEFEKNKIAGLAG